MEDLLSTLLGLIPIAVIIGVKILTSKKSREEGAEKQRLASVLEQVAESGDDFDAYALVPDEDEEEEPRPVHKPAARHSFAYKIREEGQPLTTLRPTEYPEQPAPAPQPHPEAAAHRSAQAPEAGARFAARLERLSPLKRAVVMAEVLGPPKSL